MANDFARTVLRRWAAGKTLPKSQLAELHRDGLICTLDTGETRLTKTGIDLINRKDHS